MLVVLSPAKSLDLESPVSRRKFTQPEFLSEAGTLVKDLRKLSPEDLSGLMHMSSKLGALNYERYANWHVPFDRENARPAIFTFIGDVYQGLEAASFSTADLNFAQKHLRILSGLYGVLKPLDLMQAYRLEMGTRLATGKGRDLYSFWGDKLTRSLNQDLAAERGRILVNLASNEYFSAVDTASLDGKVVTPAFKDYSNGKYRFLSFFAKQARGMMAAYIIKNRVTSVAKLKDFNTAGYQYSAEESSETKPVFLRRNPS
ncbi:MAG: peroxide stress protein YaaA [Gammaproteobacteria bacterium]|nr:peroxide stress protein YaaA [Pseudomonadales bacterium]MCP5347736.1 peroxide stress protein YaaA [Pseudomonadales bacterium]